MMKYYNRRSSFLITVLLIITIRAFPQAGLLDLTFDNDGIAITDIGDDDEIFAVAVRQDGIITVAGQVSETFQGNFTLIQYLPDGSLNPAFGIDGTITLPIGEFSEARSVIYLPDNSILVGGFGSTAYGTPDFAVARCLPNGMLDSTFGVNGSVITDLDNDDDDFAYSMAIQDDGKIVLGGIKAEYNQDFALVRYHLNGTPDSTFGVNGIVINDPLLYSDDNLGKDVVIQADGKILLGGSDDGYPMIIRYHSDGTLDNSFNGTGFFLAPFGDTNTDDVEIQTDGKILLAGSFYGSLHQSFVYRFLENGTPDSTFGINGLSIVEFDSVDVDFRDMTLQIDGKIILAGHIFYPSNADFLICRLNTNGVVDSTFNGSGMVTTDIGGSERCNAVALQPDGKLIAAGKTVYSSGTSDFAVTRYLTSLTLSADDIFKSEHSSFIYPNPLSDEAIFNYELPKASVVMLQLYDLDGQIICTFFSEKKNKGIHSEVLNLKGIPVGTYLLELQTGNHMHVIKVIKQ